MTTYLLTREHAVTLESDRFTVRPRVTMSQSWHLEMRAGSEQVADFPAPRRVGEEWLVQNPAAYGVVAGSLHIVCDDGTFVAGQECEAVLDIGAGGRVDATFVRLEAVDLSGGRSVELVRLDVDSSGAVARFTLALPEMDIQDDSAMSMSARHALAEARARLDIHHVDAAQSINLVVAVDGSASMLAVAGRGDLAAAVDTLHGLSHVLSQGKTFGVVVVDQSVRRVPHDDSETPGESVAAVLERADARVGATLAHSTLRRTNPIDNTMTYILTDRVPGDADQIAKDATEDGEARHLIILGAGHDDAALAAELGLPVTSWRHGLRPEDSDYRQVVFGLLRSCFDPASDYAKKLRL